MCVIALVKKGHMLSADHLRAMFRTNPDGGGFGYVQRDGKVEIRKGFMKEEGFVKGYQDTILDSGANDRGPHIVHTRIATLGKVCMDNCHPFRIRGGALAHNGTLWHGVNGDSAAAEKSDTREYAERMHNNLDYEAADLAADGLGKMLQARNRLAMLYDHGKYVIVNEREGFWREDEKVWFSNLTWMSCFTRIQGMREQDARRELAHGHGARRYENT